MREHLSDMLGQFGHFRGDLFKDEAYTILTIIACVGASSVKTQVPFSSVRQPAVLSPRNVPARRLNFPLQDKYTRRKPIRCFLVCSSFVKAVPAKACAWAIMAFGRLAFAFSLEKPIFAM